MNCDELVELVTDYLEDRLPRADVARFEAHLAECPGCDNYLGQIKLLLRLAPEAREPAVTSLAVKLLPAFHIFVRVS
jgi:predicted anti-sigma-YlaC factor YlaD